MTRPIVYTGGTFDLFHHGHAHFLEQASRLGDVVVALNTDDFIRRYKGKPPVNSYVERATVLAACRYVTTVTPNDGGADSRPTIERIRPGIIAIGTDWAIRDYYAQMGFTQEWLDERGILLVYLPYTLGVSTTELRRRLA